MYTNKVVIFADAQVGLEVLKFMFSEYPGDIAGIVVNASSNSTSEILKEYDYEGSLIHSFTKNGNASLLEFLRGLGEINYIISAWWPYIIKKDIFECPRFGTINFHPSLLPYNRGKNYNFWNLVEEVPFGVSLHFIDEGIDTGDVIFQEAISKSWLDTGETLYHKAQKAIVNLYKRSYKDIRRHNYKRIKQNLQEGSFHLSKELDISSRIDLNKNYRGRDLINLLRARTFPPYPSCFFEDETGRFGISVKITKLVENEE